VISTRRQRSDLNDSQMFRRNSSTLADYKELERSSVQNVSQEERGLPDKKDYVSVSKPLKRYQASAKALEQNSRHL